MAIDSNRIKYGSNIWGFFTLIWTFGKRLTILCLFALVFKFLYLSPSQKLSTITLEASGNVLAMAAKLYDKLLEPVNSLRNSLNMLNDLSTENMELKLKLEKYKSLESTSKHLEAQNIELRKMLQVIPDAKYKRKTARLLSISLNPFNKTVLIGAGTNDGIVSDQVVATEEGLLGRIIEVSPNYSKVMLINDGDSRIPVITSISHERAILTGDNRKINLNYLSDPNSVKENEIILTSGDGRIYPYGIPVAEVIKNENGRISLEPIMNVNKTEFVHIYNLQK